MKFERGKDPREILNIGRITEAFRADHIRAVVEVHPCYYYGYQKTGGRSPVTITIGVIISEEDFIKNIQEGNTIPLREFLIKRAEKQAKSDSERNLYVIGEFAHYSFRNNEIFICAPGDILNEEKPIEKFWAKDIVYNEKFHRYPEDLD